MAGKHAITETYLECESSIIASAKTFYRKMGGDLEEIIAQANEIFVDAYYKFDPDRAGDFLRYLRFLLPRRLMENFRKEHAHDYLMPRVNMDFKYLVQNHKPLLEPCGVPPYMQFLDSLSNDGEAVCGMVISPPLEVVCKLYEKGNERTKQHWISSIRAHLKELGWSLNRISTTIKEIQEKINYDQTASLSERRRKKALKLSKQRKRARRAASR